MPMLRWALPLSVLLGVLFIYWGVQGFSYVWDDLDLFVNSPALRTADNIWFSVSQPILSGTTYFRPAVLLSFIAEFNILGLNPTYSHIVNLIFHLINVALVGMLASLMAGRGQSQWRVFIAMVVYGFHPALIEPVAWVAGRFDLMVTTGVLLGLVASIRLKGFPRILLVCASFLIAAFSKEMAVTFPALFALVYWAKEVPDRGFPEIWRDFYKRPLVGVLVALLITGLVYLALRYYVHPSVIHQDNRVAAALSPSSHIEFIGETLFFYLKMAVWPFSDLGPLHPFDMGSLHDSISGIIALSIVIVFCIYVFFKGGRSLILFCAGLVSLLPVLQIVPLTIGGNIGHERFLTLPLTFFALSVSQASLGELSVSSGMKRFLPLFAGAGTFLWMIWSVLNVTITLPMWKDDMTLWSWAYEKHPEFEFAQTGIVLAALNQGRLETAGRALTLAEAKGELSPDMKVLKAYFLLQSKKPEEAIALAESALDGLYLIHKEMEEQGINIKGLSVTYKQVPNLWVIRIAYTVLAGGYLELKNYDAALSAVEIFRFYQPDFAVGYLFEAMAWYGKDNVELAQAAYEKALKLYAAPNAKNAEVIRRSYLKELCSDKGRAGAKVCELFSAES